MKNIVIIGSGQLGSRHLQSLASSRFPLAIQVFDTSEDALKVAEQRFAEVSGSFKGSISFQRSLSELPAQVDVAIVASGSKARRAIIEELLHKSRLNYLILEKFLFTKETDYAVVSALLKEKGVKTWVNCARRMYPFYRSLQQELIGPIQFTVTGNNWGMGCNGIHMLDLFSMLSGRTDIQLQHQLIDPVVQESKRAGYVEFTGSIVGNSGPHSFLITSFDASPSPLHLIINTPTVRYSIQEGATAKVWISRLEKNWDWEETSFSMPFQSQLTHLVVDELLEKGSCQLPEYEVSAALHLHYLKNLISFLQENQKDSSISECLIT